MRRKNPKANCNIFFNQPVENQIKCAPRQKIIVFLFSKCYKLRVSLREFISLIF